MENGKFHKFSFRKHGKTNQKARLKTKPTSPKINKRNPKQNDDYTSRDKEKMLGRDERNQPMRSAKSVIRNYVNCTRFFKLIL